MKPLPNCCLENIRLGFGLRIPRIKENVRLVFTHKLVQHSTPKNETRAAWKTSNFCRQKVHWKEHVLLSLGYNHCAAKHPIFVMIKAHAGLKFPLIWHYLIPGINPPPPPIVVSTNWLCQTALGLSIFCWKWPCSNRTTSLLLARGLRLHQGACLTQLSIRLSPSKLYVENLSPCGFKFL